MQPIGIIHTQFQSLQEMPIQPSGAANTVASITLQPQLQAGLQDLEGFSHIYLIYQFHLSKGYQLTVTPFLDDKPHGLFSTRAPKRPNPIGLSLVELISINDNVLQVRGADVIDGTPLLDIKPYIDAFDCISDTRSGWMTASAQQVQEKRSDHRFSS